MSNLLDAIYASDCLAYHVRAAAHESHCLREEHERVCQLLRCETRRLNERLYVLTAENKKLREAADTPAALAAERESLLAAERESLRADSERLRADSERLRAESAALAADRECLRAESERLLAAERECLRAESERECLREESERLLAAERECLRADSERLRTDSERLLAAERESLREESERLLAAERESLRAESERFRAESERLLAAERECLRAESERLLAAERESLREESERLRAESERLRADAAKRKKNDVEHARLRDENERMVLESGIMSKRLGELDRGADERLFCMQRKLQNVYDRFGVKEVESILGEWRWIGLFLWAVSLCSYLCDYRSGSAIDSDADVFMEGVASQLSRSTKVVQMLCPDKSFHTKIAMLRDQVLDRLKKECGGPARGRAYEMSRLCASSLCCLQMGAAAAARGWTAGPDDARVKFCALVGAIGTKLFDERMVFEYIGIESGTFDRFVSARACIADIY